MVAAVGQVWGRLQARYGGVQELVYRIVVLLVEIGGVRMLELVVGCNLPDVVMPSGG